MTVVMDFVERFFLWVPAPVFSEELLPCPAYAFAAELALVYGVTLSAVAAWLRAEFAFYWFVEE